MKKLVSIIVALILLFAVVGCQTQNSIAVTDSTNETINQLTMKEKLEDFESLYKVLEENYPFFEVNKRMNGIDWLANKDKYINRINLAMTEQLYKEALDNILRDLNNGHTNIIDKDFYNYAKASYEGNKGDSKPWLEQINKPKSVLRYSDKNYSGKVIETSADQAAGYIIPNNVYSEIMVDKKVAYLGIASLNPFNIEGDMKVIRPFLDSIKTYNALIIDIRQNGGGSSSYWSDNLVPMLIDKPISWKTFNAYRGGAFAIPFIHARYRDSKQRPIKEIVKENLLNTPPELMDDFHYYKKSEEVIQPKDSTGFKGKIYLLVDQNVYSSSEMFASFAKSTGFATLVGETTGGDGIGQDPLFYSLPNSGYIMRFPCILGLTADGSCNEEHKTVPNIKVAAEKTKDVKNDEAIQYVINLYK